MGLFYLLKMQFFSVTQKNKKKMQFFSLYLGSGILKGFGLFSLEFVNYGLKRGLDAILFLGFL